jgi:ATP/maltotriose-dependent transcriptional regulator MalT
LEGDAAGVAELRKAAPRATGRERALLDALFADAAFASGHAKEAKDAAYRVMQGGASGVARNLAEAVLVLAGEAAPTHLTPLVADTAGPAGDRDEGEAVVRSRAMLRHAEAHLLYGDVDAAEALLGAPGELDGRLPWDAVGRTRLRAQIALRQGRLTSARQLLVKALGALPPAAAMARAVLREPLAETLFGLGEHESAMAILDELVPVFQRAGMARMEAAARITVGRLAWSVGEHDVAAACLERARRVDPFAPVGDLVALLTELARHQQARAWLARIDSRPNDPASPLDVLRARANVANDPTGFERAIEVLRRGQLVLPEAELLIDLVAWHHRRSQWAEVHRAGELAARVLVPTGLQAWTDRLDRFEPPAPPPMRDVPPALASLTDAERRVALAITRGLTNKEAAAELFVSVKTVDSHLQRIYPKLAVRSRAELAVLVSSAMSAAGATSGAALGHGTGNPPDAER